MKCQRCSAPATVHLTSLENNEKKEIHLCQQCAEENQLIEQDEINLPAILQTFLGPHVDPETDALSRMACPHCGIKYMELRSAGRLGCPHDYEVFEAGLAPLLKKIHRAVKHCGKTPLHHRDALLSMKEIEALRKQLRTAIDNEAYEEAARIRDLLREKEATNESG